MGTAAPSIQNEAMSGKAVSVPRHPEGWWCLLGVLMACQPRPGAGEQPAPGSRTSTWFEPTPVTVATGPIASARRSEAPSVIALQVPGFLPAVLMVPAVAETETRPLLVAAHGAGGSPEWECDYWSRLVHDYPFILCLRGARMGEGMFYYPNHHALAAELDAAVAATRARFANVADTAGLYAGFSQGASMGSLMIAERAAAFPFVVLIEGFTQWNIPLGRAFAKRGGQAVLFACGTRDCSSKASASASALEQAGVRARAETAPGVGHTPLGGVQERVSANVPWLLQGDSLWQAHTNAQP